MTIRSRYPEVTIPEMSLTDFVFQRVREHGGRTAFVDGIGGRRLTFDDLERDIRRVAASLARRGFRKGDVFAIFSPNCIEYPVVFHAVALLGGINTTVNPLYTADELAGQLRDCAARFLVTVPGFLETARQAASGSSVEEIFVFGEAAGATPFEALLESDGRVQAARIEPRADLVALPYSSGTTGLPKGVMLTHHNIVANLCQTECVETTTADDTVVGVLPFFHIYGLVVIMNLGIFKGLTTVTMPRFDLESFLRVLQDHRVTRAYLVPPIVLALAKQPIVERFDLSKLRAIMSGAAPLGEEVARECAGRVGCIVKQGYGLTETSPVSHLNPDPPGTIKAGSVGPCTPNTECQVVDPQTGKEVGVGEEGEIWIRGPQVMKGYLDRPQATAETIDAEGWLHTGDIGHVDEDGYFYIVDRVKELIKYKGFQVAPAELEALLLTHAAIADAAVIPSPDEEAGEVPKGFVVLKGEATEQEILEHVARRVAPHKKLRRLEIVDAIPRSPSGKILRRVLVRQERERLARDAEEER